MSIQVRTVLPKRLSQRLTSTGLLLFLNNIQDNDYDDSAASLSASDFGTTIYALLRNSTSTQIEIIEITASTIANAITTGATITKRGLGYNGGTTADVETAYDWPANETIVELGSDVPQLLADFVNLQTAQTVAGKKTFTTVPASTAAPVAGDDLVNLTKLNATALGTTTVDKLIVAGNAGETVSAGQLLYFDTGTNNEWMKCDADTAASVDNVILGIAQGAGTDGNAISGGVLLRGIDDNQSGMTAGDPQFASNTAGGISSSAGTTEVQIGAARTATSLYFDPRYNQQITEAIQDALAGNGGTISGSNLYVSQQGLQEGSETYAEDAGGDDTYVIALSPAVASYTDGMVVRFLSPTGNTGACTLDAGGGAQSIKKYGDAGLQDLDTNDIQAGQTVTVVYETANSDWILQGAPIISVADAVDLTDAGNTTLHYHNVNLNDNNQRVVVVGNKDDGLTETVPAQWTVARSVVWTKAGNTGSAAAGYGILIGANLFDTLKAADLVTWGKSVEFSIWLRVNGTATQNTFFGICETGGGFDSTSVPNDGTSTQRHIGFFIDDATIYSSNGNNTTQTRNSIAGTATNWNHYRFVWTTGSSIAFYFNGTLAQTHSTNLPSGTGQVALYIGTENTAAVQDSGIEFGNNYIISSGILS